MYDLFSFPEKKSLPISKFRDRRAVSIENEHLRVTLMQEGGHVAEILEKKTGVNPLWIPPWPTIEPSTYSLSRNPEYGADAESRLLSGIMGHNLCLDVFGWPSAEEIAAGLGVHGEAPVVPYEIDETDGAVCMRAELPLAAIRFERRVKLHGSYIRFREVVENLSATDRPIGWTEHVTLGPPFVERGVTQFRCSATRSKTFEGNFGAVAYLQPESYLQPNTEFIWPMAPSRSGGQIDLRVYNAAKVSGAFTTHLMDPGRDDSFFTAYSPSLQVAIGYIWKRADFPWLGIWEENCSRPAPPWNKRTITRGMEFGVSPFTESRRKMAERGHMFGVPAYRWLPAKGCLEAEYWATAQKVADIPESLTWPGEL